MVAAAVVFVLGGCGGQSSEDDAAAEKSRVAEKAAQQRQKALEERRARQSALYTECRRVAGPLDDKLVALNSRLSVGLPLAKYSDQVGSAKVAYDRFVRDAKARGGVSDQCINRVGLPLESALNAYIKAYNTWNDCVDDAYCSFDDGSPALKKTQAAWGKAARLLTRADAALTNLQP